MGGALERPRATDHGFERPTNQRLQTQPKSKPTRPSGRATNDFASNTPDRRRRKPNANNLQRNPSHYQAAKFTIDLCRCCVGILASRGDDRPRPRITGTLQAARAMGDKRRATRERPNDRPIDGDGKPNSRTQPNPTLTSLVQSTQVPKRRSFRAGGGVHSTKYC